MVRVSGTDNLNDGHRCRRLSAQGSFFSGTLQRGGFHRVAVATLKGMRLVNVTSSTSRHCI